MFEFLQPNLLALFAAILLAVANILYRDSLRELSPAAASFVTHLVMGSIACGVYAASGGVEKWPLAGILWLLLAGFVGNFLGRYLLFVSIHYIGVARTTVLSQTQPIWSSILALIFLGESIGLGAGAGTLGIVIGASIIVLGRKEKEEEGVLNTTLTLYFLPFLVALVHAIAPIFRKFGFALIPSAPFAIGVATLFSAALQLAVLSFTERGEGHRWDRGALRSIVIGASINTLAALDPIVTGSTINFVSSSISKYKIITNSPFDVPAISRSIIKVRTGDNQITSCIFRVIENCRYGIGLKRAIFIKVQT
ncbi:MAG: DMT family transporter [Nitrospinota bacterium]|nr:DMT family transporter [Nitrospinota bacterium]